MPKSIEGVAFQKLKIGDWIEMRSGDLMRIRHFGFWTGKRWKKSSRKRANGVWVRDPRDESEGFVHKVWIVERSR